MQCTRSASCRCDDCVAAMGMFSAKDLLQVSSSKVDFGDDGNSANQEKVASKDDSSSTMMKSKENIQAAKTIIEKANVTQDMNESTNNDITTGSNDESHKQPVKTTTAESNSPAPMDQSPDDDQEDFSSRSLDSLLEDSNWKARKFAYEKIQDICQTEKPDVSIKAILKEPTVGALDGALDCVLAYFKNHRETLDDDQIGSAVRLLFAKALSGRPGTVKRAEELILAFMEKGTSTASAVLDALFEGLSQKSPKLVAECINCVKEAVNAFGATVLPLTTLQNFIKDGLGQTNPSVRKTATALAVDIDGWFAGAFKDIILPQISTETTRKELERALSNSKPPAEPLKPSRSIAGAAPVVAAAGSGDSGDLEGELYAVLPEKNVLEFVAKSNLEKRLQETKWTERKNAISEITAFCGKIPKLTHGDYNDLVRSMKAVIQSDSNQAVVVEAILLLGVLARGLRGEFHNHARSALGLLMFRLREKKMPVIAAVSGSIDSFASHCFQVTEERVVAVIEENTTSTGESGKQKNTPLQKTHVAEWLKRCFANGWAWKKPELFDPSNMSKLVSILVNLSSDGDAKVREMAIEALAVLHNMDNSTVPENVKHVLEHDLPKLLNSDPKLVAKLSAANAPAPTPAPVATRAAVDSKPSSTSAPAPSEQPPAPTKTAAAKKPVKKAVTASAVGTSSTPVAFEADSMSEDASVDAVCAAYSDNSAFSQAYDLFKNATKWQDKVAIFDFFIDSLSGEDARIEQQVAHAVAIFISHLTKSFKEANFNIVKKAFELGVLLVKRSDPSISKAYVNNLLEGGVKKLGDKKLIAPITDLFVEASEVTSTKFVSSRLLHYINKISAPKANEDACAILTKLGKEFGAQLMDIRAIMDYLVSDRCLNSRLKPNKDVAVECLVMLFQQLGEPIRQALGNNMNDVIEGAFANVQPAVAPSRKCRGEEASGAGMQDVLNQLNPQSDVSGLLSSALLQDLSDESSKTSWKNRLKAIEEIISIMDGAQRNVVFSKQVRITVAELRKRFHDTNGNLVPKALAAMGVIGASVGGDGVATLAKGTGEPIMNCLSDGKKAVLSAIETCLEQWTIHTGAVHQGAFLSLVVSSFAPLANSRLDRKIILAWFCKHCTAACAANPTEPPVHDVLCGIVAPLLSCLQSRDPVTRKLAVEATGHVVQFLGVEGKSHFQNACRDLKPAVARGVIPLLKEAYELSSLAPEDLASPTEAGESNAPASPVKKHVESDSMVAKAAHSQPKVEPTIAASVKPVAKEIVHEEQHEQWFKSVDPSLRERREDKGRRNRWPSLFDEKDKRRMKEYSDSLRDDMDKVLCRELLLMMFTSADDGRQARGSALDPAFRTLMEEMPNFGHETLEAFDLLLKWSTLQLLNNNSTVTNNTLQLLEMMFEMARGANYAMSDYEASAFLPHLLNKLGEKQKRFRDAIRVILTLLCQCYPFSKYLPYLFAELSPKQRSIYILTECLGEVARLIHVHGLSVLKVKLGVGQNLLRTLVSFVDDSRKEVRASSLEAIAKIYEHSNCNKDEVFHIFAVFKVQMSDKSQTLVENYLASHTRTCDDQINVEDTAAATVPVRHLKLNHAAVPPSPPKSNESEPGFRSPARAFEDKRLQSSNFFDIELPETPPSPKERKRFQMNPVDSTPEKENNPNTDLLSHAMQVSSLASYDQKSPGFEDDSAFVKQYGGLIKKIDTDVRGYRDLILSENAHNSASVPVRDAGIKALALLANREPPLELSMQHSVTQKKWIDMLCNIPVASVLESLLDIVDHICKGALIASTTATLYEENRTLKLVLPAVLTLSWWPELRGLVEDDTMCRRWISSISHEIGRLMLQMDRPNSAITSPEEANDIVMERSRLLKTSQTILAKLSETRIWLAAIVKMFHQADASQGRLRTVLASVLTEYILVQESLFEPYHCVSLEAAVEALNGGLAVQPDDQILTDVVKSLMKLGKKFTDALHPPGKVQSLRVLVAKLMMAQTKKGQSSSQLPAVITDDDQILLTAIFSRIAAAIEEQNLEKRGLAFDELFQFDDNHPGFDAAAQLGKSSDWFKKYVMEELEKHRSTSNTAETKTKSDQLNSDISSIRDRISQLRKDISKREMSSAGSSSIPRSPPASPSRPQKIASPTQQTSTESAGSTLEAIRERMAKLRRENVKSTN